MIGGGIIGCAISYYLAKAGAQVTLVERDTLASKASRGTFAWINATWAKQPRHYHRLNQIRREGGIQDKEDVKKYQSERVRTTATTCLLYTSDAADE